MLSGNRATAPTPVMKMLNITQHDVLVLQRLQSPLRYEVQSWLRIGTCVRFASRLSVKERGIWRRLLICKSMTHWWTTLNAEMTRRWWWGFVARIRLLWKPSTTEAVIEYIQLPHHHLSLLGVIKVSRLSMTARFWNWSTKLNKSWLKREELATWQRCQVRLNWFWNGESRGWHVQFNTTAKRYNSINSTRETESEFVCSPSLNLPEIINLVADHSQDSVDGNESAHVMSMAFYQGGSSH